jgi:hypothetical protein
MADEKFETWGVLVDSLTDAIKLASKTPKFRIRMQFDEEERFDFLCKTLIKQPHGLEVFRDCCIAVDELAMFVSSQWMPDNLRNLIRLGRHTGAGLIATTQRPPDIHPFIRSQAKQQYLFQMHEPADLQVFAKRVPQVERLTQLRIGEYILWQPLATNENFSLTLSRESLSPQSTELSNDLQPRNENEESNTQ